MPIGSYILVFLVALISGYFGFWLVLKLLPGRLNARHKSQKDEVLAEAKRQAEAIFNEAKANNQAKVQLLLEDFETDLKDRKEDLVFAESELDSREKSLQPAETTLQKIEAEMAEYQNRVGLAQTKLSELTSLSDELNRKLVQSYEEKAQVDSQNLIQGLRDQIVEVRQRDIQKSQKLSSEELNSAAKRIASRFLSRAMSRYAPDFPWPKMTNYLEVENQKIWEILQGDTNGLLARVKQQAGIEVTFAPPQHQGQHASLRLSGGMGVDREAARLALIDVIKYDPNSWAKSDQVYKKHRDILEQYAVKLGRQAVTELQLQNIHPEVQKLVGYLNWRTSYRQNQFLHSLEVAVLAGVVATELGVDPDEAKRCGLLHDIGKALDYRIEGSHAVISGDYADRYGETRLICDTLMSHHNDLVVETPLAFVLKTADTLSGARPGARVNLEEGYQDRLSAIDDVLRSFPGITKSGIMNGGREVHIEVNHKRVSDDELEILARDIAKKIETDVAFPGAIKVLVTRRFESTAVA